MQERIILRCSWSCFAHIQEWRTYFDKYGSLDWVNESWYFWKETFWDCSEVIWWRRSLENAKLILVTWFWTAKIICFQEGSQFRSELSSLHEYEYKSKDYSIIETKSYIGTEYQNSFYIQVLHIIFWNFENFTV